MFNGKWMRAIVALVMLMTVAGIASAEEPWTEATMVQAGMVDFEADMGLGDAGIDEQGGYAYFTALEGLVKVALGGRSDAPRVAATMTIGEHLGAMVIDPERGYAYIGGGIGNPGRIYKMALGKGDAPPKVTAVLRLLPEEEMVMYSEAGTAAIDVKAGYAYLGFKGQHGSPTKLHVVKVALGTGTAPPTRAGSVTLPDASRFGAAVIDPAKGYAYFLRSEVGAESSIVKVALGQGSSAPRITGTLSFRDMGNLSQPYLPSFFAGGAIDVQRGYAYFPVRQSTNDSSQRYMLLKIALGEGDSAPVYLSAGSIGDYDREYDPSYVGQIVRFPMVHPARGDIYLPTPNQLLRMAPGAHASEPLLVEKLDVLAGMRNAVISPSRDAIYIGGTGSFFNKINISADADETLWLPSGWHFAEGATHPTFQTYYLLANPNDEPLHLEAEYLPESGPSIVQSVTVPANGRHTILANNILANQGLSASFRAPSGKGFAAERAMYSMGPNNRWYGAHAAVGTSKLGSAWYFAEGSTGPAGPEGDPFSTFILVANPNNYHVRVHLVTSASDGNREIERLIPPKSRLTIEPGKEIPGLAGKSFSAQFYPLNGTFIAERAMWWRSKNWPAGSFYMEGTASPGILAGPEWLLVNKNGYMAEGNTDGFDDFILLANQGPTNDVRIRYFLEDGSPIDRTLALARGERRTINVRWDPEGIGKAARYGAMVTATYPIAVERSMYFNGGGFGWVGGHNSLASPGLSRKWMLPEGATVPGPVGNIRTEIQILNPQNVPANVEVRFLLDQGATHSEHITIPAERRHTILANDIPELAAKAFSTVVLSSEPIVVDRTMYFDGDTPGLISPIGSTASAGIPASALSLLPKGYAASAEAVQSATSNDAWTLYSPSPTATVTPTPVLLE